ncbi:L10-interacting MYB domain-containing protein-like [Macadamia integrifolia]|uniref:L10-interacting MYB domain-containing protein-like n=1 Tax=Macadamia integrifolia TaxID=60698 RepID=UPI001C4F6552|nr:L10-interacting MYB domain-containing protein-like [Macadamia integrifolia]
MRSPKTRTPKSSTIIWNEAEVKAFINHMVENVRKGQKTNSTFTKVGWDNIKKGLEQEFSRPFAREQLRNKMNKLRRQHNSFRRLLEMMGFGWDANARTATAEDLCGNQKLRYEYFIRFRYEKKEWAKYRREGLPWWPELLEIFSDSSARGDRGLSQTIAITPTSTNVVVDDDEFQDTEPDVSEGSSGEPDNSAPPRWHIDRTPTDCRRKSQTRTLTNSAQDLREFVRWRMEKGNSFATSAVVRPLDPMYDGPHSIMSCQKLLDTLEELPSDLYVLAQRKIHSDVGWRLSFVEVMADRRLWMIQHLKDIP